MEFELDLLNFNNKSNNELVNKVIDGEFKYILTTDLAKNSFKSIDFDSGFNDNVNKVLINDDDDDQVKRLFLIGIALLNSFVQVNWTGPDLDFNLSDLNNDWNDYDFINMKAIHKLSLGGEPAYHLTKFAPLLLISQFIFNKLSIDSIYSEKLPLKSVHWWRFRSALSQQHLLDECVPFKEGEFNELHNDLLENLKSYPSLHARLTLEIGICYHMFENDKEASETFLRAANISELQFHLTGALGKRTKFQQSDITQLVLLAQSKGSVDESSSKVKNLELNDDTLLEQTQFSSTVDSTAPLSHIDPSNQPKLSALDQCILLAMCLNIKNTSPENGLTNSQMGAFVSRVLSNHQNWSIYTMGLLLRSRLEGNRTRTVQRATLQLQALIDQMPTNDSSISERLKYFFAMPMPTKWELERELAQRFLSLGIVRSALEIYLRLELWEDTILCYVSTERHNDALITVKGLLEGTIVESDTITSRAKSTVDSKTKTRMDVMRAAKLWCLYGDLDVPNCVKHYEKALEVSNGSSARAYRSLGGYYFVKGDSKNTIDVLRKGLSINPLYHKSWFVLGCASIKVEDWDGAIEAFGRCVKIEDDDAESWNNLASVYLRLGDNSVPHERKVDAHRALKQGTRCGFDNWRIWENFMVVSVDVGELSDAARAIGRLVDIRGERICGVNDDSNELDTIDKVVDAVTRAPRNESDAIEGDASAEGAQVVHNPNEGHGLLRTIDRLFENNLLTKISSSTRIFKAYAKLLLWKGKYREALETHLKAYRASIASDSNVETDTKTFKSAVLDIMDLVDIMRNFGDKPADVNDVQNQDDASPDWRFQARSIVRTFLGRTKNSFEDEPEYDQLKEVLQDLKRGD